MVAVVRNGGGSMWNHGHTLLNMETSSYNLEARLHDSTMSMNVTVFSLHHFIILQLGMLRVCFFYCLQIFALNIFDSCLLG